MTIRLALVQCDTIPQQPQRNLETIERLSRAAAKSGARWVMFHEGTLHDYSERPMEQAEEVPAGPSTRRVIALARELGITISFGLVEREDTRCFITQAFVNPGGCFYRYRKTWLWREASDEGYRNEWTRFDPGTGPELFHIDGIRATCFICADGEAPRCIARAASLQPQLVFYPNNRGALPAIEVFGNRAREIGAPMLVTNRIGKSWVHDCQGGCVVYGADGQPLVKANRDGCEEILLYDLALS